MGKLDGKVALITGAGIGIGRSAAIMFAEEGAELVIAGRRQAVLDVVVAEITSPGGQITAKSADMEDQTSIEALAAYALEKHGRVDILVNNAGHSSKVRSVRWISRGECDSVYAVNVSGPAQLTRLLLPPMLDHGEGTVIMVSSMAALRPGPCWVALPTARPRRQPSCTWTTCAVSCASRGFGRRRSTPLKSIRRF